MSSMIFPESYRSSLTVKETEIAIKIIKDFFQVNLSTELRLRRVTAPILVKTGTGVNDDLNGTEKPVSFNVPDMNNERAEIVQSLAKWKRMMLADLEIKNGFGLYTDMNAIRPDETLDNTHSLYVDQWDWERRVGGEERNLDFLKKVVNKIYGVLLRTEFLVCEHYPSVEPVLPDEITFVQAEDLAKEYPELTPPERESVVAEKYGAVFIIGIGSELSDGKPHDGRAPDYDDWTTETREGYKGLNGDIVVWNPILEKAYEISSMGIRVDREALQRQLEISEAEDRRELYFHKRLLNDELPLSIGGGIGQSRLCMFLLKKAHIGEIQVSLWPEDMKEKCREHGIHLL